MWISKHFWIGAVKTKQSLWYFVVSCFMQTVAIYWFVNGSWIIPSGGWVMEMAKKNSKKKIGNEYCK